MTAPVDCPYCRQQFQVTDATSGLEYACPYCRRHFRLVGSAPASPPEVSRAAPHRRPGIQIQRTCPACGARYPGDERRCPECGAGFKEAKYVREDISRGESGEFFGPEKAGVSKGVVGGLVMIAIAAIWFFAGWAAGYIFFYPPILALIGGFALVKGLLEGNLAGERSRRRPARRGRRAPARRRARG